MSHAGNTLAWVILAGIGTAAALAAVAAVIISRRRGRARPAGRHSGTPRRPRRPGRRGGGHR